MGRVVSTFARMKGAEWGLFALLYPFSQTSVGKWLGKVIMSPVTIPVAGVRKAKAAVKRRKARKSGSRKRGESKRYGSRYGERNGARNGPRNASRNTASTSKNSGKKTPSPTPSTPKQAPKQAPKPPPASVDHWGAPVGGPLYPLTDNLGATPSGAIVRLSRSGGSITHVQILAPDRTWFPPTPASNPAARSLIESLVRTPPDQRKVPRHLAKMYAASTGECLMCGKALSGAASKKRGYGPECAKKVR